MKAYFSRKWRTRLGAVRARTKMALGLGSEGFFIPYPYADQIESPRTSYAAVEHIFSKQDAIFRSFIEEMAEHLETFKQFGSDPLDPTWGRSMFPALDGAIAYTMVRKLRPSQILEIGSGNSTHFLARALSDGKIDGQLTCIDPAPRRPIDRLGAHSVRRILAEEDANLCADFQPNDVLFIDSSHIMLPGLDVDIQFNRMFPLLAPGSVVHIHDIFLPYDYPSQMRSWLYSEQNALIGWIVSGYFEVLFPAYYAARTYEALLYDRLGRHFRPFAAPGPGSIWLRRPLNPNAA